MLWHGTLDIHEVPPQVPTPSQRLQEPGTTLPHLRAEVYLSKQLVKVNVHVSSNVHQLVRLWQTDPAVQSTVASSITMKPV